MDIALQHYILKNRDNLLLQYTKAKFISIDDNDVERIIFNTDVFKQCKGQGGGGNLIDLGEWGIVLHFLLFCLILLVRDLKKIDQKISVPTRSSNKWFDAICIMYNQLDSTKQIVSDNDVNILCVQALQMQDNVASQTIFDNKI